MRAFSAHRSLIAVVGVSACAKKKPALPPAPPRRRPRSRPGPRRHRPAPPPPAPREAAPAAPETEVEIFAKATLEELNAQKLLADAFFELDSRQITRRREAGPPEGRRLDEAMGRRRGDGRGTTPTRAARTSTTSPSAERRSTAARDLGVGADRITAFDTVSKGKEQPFCAEEMNPAGRRTAAAHFVITAK